MNKNLLIVLAFLLFNIGYGQKTWTGATSTAWDTDSNWSPVGRPTSTENVLITNSANQPVISITGATCAILTLSNSTPATSVTLTVKTSTNGTFSPASIIMNSSGGGTSVCSLNINTGRVVTGNVTMNLLQNNVTFSDDGTLFVGGIMTGGTLNANDKGTVNYSGSGIRDVGTYSYNDLTISGSGTRTISSGVIVNGTFTMGGSAKASAAPTYGANASLLYNSTSALTVGPEWVNPFIASGGIEISNPTLDPGASVVTISDGLGKMLGEGVSLVIDEEAALVTNGDIYLEGDLMNNRGSLKTDGYVYLAGNRNQSIDSFTAAKGVVMNKTGGVATFTEDITSKELIINGQGTLNLGIGRTHAFTNWTRTQGTLDGSSSTLKFSGNVIGTGGDFIAGTGTVAFSGEGAQNLGLGSITYNNLVLSKGGVKTFGAKTTINETITIEFGTRADLTANLIHSAKAINLDGIANGGSWGSSLSNAVNKNNIYFVSTNNGIINVGPTIAVSTSSLAGLTSTYGAPSPSKSFDISGIAMLEGIVVTPSSEFEVSTNVNGPFSNTLTVGAAGSIASTIYVRLKATTGAGSYSSGNVTLSSNGTTTINLPIALSTVDKAELTIKADDKEKFYGSVNPDLTVSYTGFVNGETVAILTKLATVTTTAVIGSPVQESPYLITASGAEALNYKFKYEPTSGSLVVKPVALTITTIDNSKVYGSVNPVLAVSYDGFVSGESEANLTTKPTISTVAVTGSAVGKYAITAIGAVSSNYEITYDNKGILNVTPAALTITTIDNSKVYGSLNPVLAVSYDGFVSGESEANLTTKPTISTVAVTGSAVGKYAITAIGAVSSNYEITYDNKGILNVTPAALTITTIDNSKVYGSLNPVLAVSYDGFVSGESEANLTTKPTISTVAITGSAVGKYAINAIGAVSSNYEITYDNKGFLNVTPAALTITTIDNSKVYRSVNPVLAVSYDGFVSGESGANLTTKPTISTVAVTGSAVGKYAITAIGAVSSNYEITYDNKGFLNVTPAALTITTIDNSKVYRSVNPVLAVSYDGFVSGESEANLTTKPTISTVAITGSAVGKYAITAIGVVSSNYEITYNNKGILNVTPAALTIKADDKKKERGMDNPVLTLSYVGFVPGETEADLTTKPTIATVAVKESPAGEYDIIVSAATSSNYTITFEKGILTVTKSSNADLSNIVISDSSLDKPFDTDAKGYKVEVPYETNTYVVNPIPVDPNATVVMTVDGKVIDPTAPFDLKVGDNVVTIVVTAEDGVTQETYTVVVTREAAPLSNDSGLTDLAISKGKLEPGFTEVNTEYTSKVPNGTTTINLTPVTSDPTAKVTIEGIEVPSGTASKDLPLKVGENTITTVVTAQDGTITTYTVVVTREAAPLSNDSGLTDLAISEGKLEPGFTEGTTAYTDTVPNDVTGITVTPITADPTATITVNGKPVPSGTASENLPLKVGENPITTVVTAQDGTITTYTVVVTREAAPLSDNSGLTDLAISKGTLSPAFAEGTTAYTDTVPNDVAGITVTPITADPTATITVNGIPVPSGTASANLPLEVGENEIKTVVTAQDGTITTYIVIVTREAAPAPDNAGLSDIALSDSSLDKPFNTDTKGYEVDVPNETDSIVITPKTIDPDATVVMTVDGKVIDPTSPIDLKVGDNEVTIVVTAPDGTTDTYIVIVNRADAVLQPIVPTNIITPNGDGKNDNWIVPGLDQYPNNSVKVFDRAARLVYSKNNYNNEWDGTYKGSPLNEDTYYYLIDLGNGSPKIKGFITIIRDNN